jgi:NAD(P)-dependent dehydrogenase (short-subunit alcohol dehydrogenase family)
MGSELAGQTVVPIGGSAGIGLETARRARREGAEVILTGRDPERLKRAALDVDARSTAAFDANDSAALGRFFEALPDPTDHILVTAGGPTYGPLLEMTPGEVRTALALELAPVRVNLIAAGFVDTPLSASLLGDQLEERRNELRTTLPIGRVVGPADVAALAVHLMTNTALTGATYDIDGGQQFVS